MSTDAIELLEDWRCLTPEYGNTKAIGQIRNNSDQTLWSVTIEGVLRDGEGVLLSVGKDTIFDVTPGSTRNFEINFMDAPRGVVGQCELTHLEWTE